MLAFLTSAIGRLIGVALIASSLSVWATSQIYSGRIAHMKLQATQNELKQFQETAKQINLAASDYISEQADNQAKFDLIRKDLKNVQVIKLPSDCKPDGERVRLLKSAVDAANSAFGSSTSRTVR